VCRAPLRTGLFGLGWPELLVIGGAALLFFGPDKLTDIAKEAGKSAAALKDASSAFQEGMDEAVKENKLESANPKKELNGSDKM
jgi:sec-independent protein translocase protein TatA